MSSGWSVSKGVLQGDSEMELSHYGRRMLTSGCYRPRFRSSLAPWLTWEAGGSGSLLPSQAGARTAAGIANGLPLPFCRLLQLQLVLKLGANGLWPANALLHQAVQTARMRSQWVEPRARQRRVLMY